MIWVYAYCFVGLVFGLWLVDDGEDRPDVTKVVMAVVFGLAWPTAILGVVLLPLARWHARRERRNGAS